MFYLIVASSVVRVLHFSAVQRSDKHEKKRIGQPNPSF